MSNRLDQEREQRLQPIRMKVAIDALVKMGFKIQSDDVKLIFDYAGHPVTFYPYSGWHTGKSIKDGRGLENLIKQLTNQSK